MKSRLDLKITKTIKSKFQNLNGSEATGMCLEIDAALFWLNRKPEWYPLMDALKVKKYQLLKTAIEKRLMNRTIPPETRQSGAVIKERTNLPQIEDFYNLYIKGGQQDMIHQDGESVVIGIPDELTLYAYCEGDVTVIECPTLKAYNSELSEFEGYYAQTPTGSNASLPYGNCVAPITYGHCLNGE